LKKLHAAEFVVIPAHTGMTTKTAFTRRGGPPWPPVSDMSIPVVALRRDRRRGIELVTASDRHGGLSLQTIYLQAIHTGFSTDPLRGGVKFTALLL